MDILGVGPLEIVFILLLALIVMGPKDLEKTGKTIGRGLNKLVRSDTWQTISQTSRKLRRLPSEFMREANLEEIKHSINQLNTDINPKIAPKDMFPEWSSAIAPKKPEVAGGPSQIHAIAPQVSQENLPE